MASTDARIFPVKNVAYRVTFPILDADGDLVTGAASLDSEVSKDGGTFADCTNEATEIATASGVYFLDLTSTEMNADTVAVIVKTATAGAKTTTLVMYPVETGDIDVDVTAFGGTAGIFASGRPEVNTTHVGGTSQTAGDIPARLPAALVSGRMDSSVGAMAANVLTATAINADAITAAKIADGAIDAATFAAGAINAAAIATDAITSAKIAADAIGASELAADAVTEIQSGLATASALSTVQADTDDIQARLPNALVGGAIVALVSGMAPDSVTASALAADAVTEIQSAILSDATPFPGARIDAAITTRATPAQVKTQVVDGLATDTYAEPGQGAPAATTSLAAKINYLFKSWRNKKDNDGTVTKLYADNGTTVDQKQDTSEAGGTVTKAEWVTGP